MSLIFTNAINLIVIIMFTFLVFFYQNSQDDYVLHIGETDDNIIEMLRHTDTLFIVAGTGGHVYGMINTIKYLNDNPEKTVIINGPCYSACTLLLSASNSTFFTQYASFHFHSSYTSSCIPDKEMMIEETNKEMLKLFDDELQEWITREGAFEKFTFTEMASDDMAKIYPFNRIDFNDANYERYEIVESEMELDIDECEITE